MGQEWSSRTTFLTLANRVLTLHSNTDESEWWELCKTAWDLLHVPKKFIMTGLRKATEEDLDGANKPAGRCL